MSESPVLVGDILAEKYRVEAILGNGGMGVVVAAWHLDLDKRFAMKFLLPALARNAEAAERFRREARAAARILSEHVARVVDVGTMSGGVPFMVMEFLDGQDLAAELLQHGPFPAEDAVDYVLQACCAIAEAHARGIVHRDLKPGNLFLTHRPDSSRLVKVLDFGISKTLGGSPGAGLSLTRTSALVGSPLYMSPEQLESARDVDLRADIWSLGVILFELLTGSVPFNGEGMPQLVRSVLSGKYPLAHEVRPGVPRELTKCVGDCLQIDLSKRLQDVSALAAAIAPFTRDGERYLRNIRSVLRPDSPVSLESSLPPRTSDGPDGAWRRNTPRSDVIASRRTPADESGVDGTSTALVGPGRLRPQVPALRGGTELAPSGAVSKTQSAGGQSRDSIPPTIEPGRGASAAPAVAEGATGLRELNETGKSWGQTHRPVTRTKGRWALGAGAAGMLVLGGAVLRGVLPDQAQKKAETGTAVTGAPLTSTPESGNPAPGLRAAEPGHEPLPNVPKPSPLPEAMPAVSSALEAVSAAASAPDLGAKLTLPTPVPAPRPIVAPGMGALPSPIHVSAASAAVQQTPEPPPVRHPSGAQGTGAQGTGVTDFGGRR